MIHVDRFAYTPQGTFGVLKMPGFHCYTLEDPWQNNEPHISCIPEGVYDLEPRLWYRGEREDVPTVEIKDVFGRTLILIHFGNTILDCEGCILVGNDLGVVDDLWAVTSSVWTFDRLTEAGLLKQDRIRIAHRQVYGPRRCAA